MYIKSITLEGFKSYGQRTVIDGLDPYFNAITGLNGSGKSNILDGICFLLGITNLSQVRASNLQELVYKNGQAGITKASVSVTFDNSNKKQTPVGYDDHSEITVTRHVVIGGRNKYTINGCNAQNNRVQDLFRSVQMNVNNPHFLIMQGRITKVLNMKPPEILSMIEEAAGTKMYESKKLTALKTIEKKDAKLREMDSILAEDVTPTLNKLRDERAAYLEYQKVERELDYVTKLCVAYQYVTEMELGKTSKANLEEQAQTIEQLKRKCEEAKAELKRTDEIITTLETKRNAECGGALLAAQHILMNIEKDEVKLSSNLQNKINNLDAEKRRQVNVEQQQSEDALAVQTRAAGLEEMMVMLEQMQEESTKDAQLAAAARSNFQAVSSGLSTNEHGQAATLAEQLISARKDVATAEIETKQAELKLGHCIPDLQKKEYELTRTAKDYKMDEAALKPLQEAVSKLESDLEKLGYEEDAHKRLTESRRVIQHDVNTLREQVDTLESRMPQTSFEYSDPHPNFDRTKIKGVVCTLFTLTDPQYATALEVIAGGKLYNVVVDNEVTGKLLMEKGNLRKRRTLIPLNKIEGRPVSQNVLSRAQQLVGKDNVCTALSLVEYDRSLQSAMEFVFGNALVCTSMDAAKKVTYDRGVMMRTVTLDGELFNPAGTLSGGSRKPGAPLLLQLTELLEAKKQLQENIQSFKRVESDLVTLNKQSSRFMEINQRIELKRHELNLVTQRLQSNPHHLQLEEVKRLQQTIEELNDIVKTCAERREKAETRVAHLEDKLKNVDLHRKRELKEAQDNMANCQKKAEMSSKRTKEKLQELEGLRLEVEELKKGLSNYDEQINEIKRAITDSEKMVDNLQKEHDSLKDQVANAKEALVQCKQQVKSLDDEISELHRKQDTMQRGVEGNKLRAKELQLEMTKMESAAKEAAHRVKALKTKYEWIASEEKYFGQPNTAYDFHANDPSEANQRLSKLHSTKEKLSKHVNMRAMTMLGKTEEQYNELITKKGIVENDKKKIASVIDELDEKKKEALQTAWQQVNQDFGAIFTSLLPGTQAKLLPPEGQTVLDGLEFKVAFGNNWKESLSELSGGQRSLVALSLILAMLRFKPAPIYILDEVDAALDLSHTQNIGTMLRTHFKHSQFIIVSLKDGMFNNANVLFKTKFVDGMSTVSRHTTSSRGHGAPARSH